MPDLTTGVLLVAAGATEAEDSAIAADDAGGYIVGTPPGYVNESYIGVVNEHGDAYIGAVEGAGGYVSTTGDILTLIAGQLVTFDCATAVLSVPPTAADDPGVAGTITWDSDFLYVCVATDTWKRVAIATWP